jgi:hypothetical protein
VPAPVRASFDREFSPYALPGQRWEMGDAIVSERRLPSRRVMFARRLGDRWVIAFEDGGEALVRRAAAYRVSADGRAAVRTALEYAGPRPCATVERLLRGRQGVR